MQFDRRSLLPLTFLVLLLVPAVTWPQAPLADDSPAVFLRPVRDAVGHEVGLDADPATPLYIAVSGQPLLAPDGHHVTLGEWIGFSGKATVKCIAGGTHVNLQVRGLLPNALYSVFLFGQEVIPGPFYFGRLPSTLPANVGSVVTNEKGHATLNAVVPAGPLSFQGAVTDCLLDNESYAFSFVYQSDGRLYPGVPGPPAVSINHALFNLFF
jgi:hypothetical protein